MCLVGHRVVWPGVSSVLAMVTGLGMSMVVPTLSFHFGYLRHVAHIGSC